MDGYREYLLGIPLSDRTIDIYCQRLAQALLWCEHRGLDLRLIPHSTARTLVADVFPKSHSMWSQARSAMGHYWDYCEVAGAARAIKVPAKPKGRWRGLEDDQVVSLLAVARTDWPRGGAVYLGVYLGLRREEIATLRWRDFDRDLSWVRILGKGDRYRDLPVHPRLMAMLTAHRWPTEWVFPGRLRGHVSLATINNWIDQMGELAGLGHIHPHQMRHTAGGKINDEGEDIYVAQDWLGHAKVETTQIYTRIKEERKLKAMRMLNWEDSEEAA